VCKTSKKVCTKSAKKSVKRQKSVHFFCQMHTLQTYAHF
jgi:hypothetical protein